MGEETGKFDAPTGLRTGGRYILCFSVAEAPKQCRTIGDSLSSLTTTSRANSAGLRPQIGQSGLNTEAASWAVLPPTRTPRLPNSEQFRSAQRLAGATSAA